MTTKRTMSQINPDVDNYHIRHDHCIKYQTISVLYNNMALLLMPLTSDDTPADCYRVEKEGVSCRGNRRPYYV